MLPALFTVGGVDVPSYGVFVGLAILAAWRVRRVEVARLGYDRTPGHAGIGFAALLGGIVGAKLGMALFVPPAELLRLGAAALTGDFTGKTVVGGIAGGYLGVELAKKLLGVRHSTGDAFAVSLPLAQGIGRIGCFFHGCCGGRPSALLGTHPTQLYEAALDLALAGALWGLRTGERPAGHLVRYALIGYATIRFVLEPLRADNGWMIGPFTAVQVFCAVAASGFAASLRR